MFCIRKLVKEQRKQTYSPEYVYEESWSEMFHQISNNWWNTRNVKGEIMMN